MAKYKVIQRFRLLDDVNVPNVGPVYEEGEVIDIKVKRADQAIKTLGSSFLERIDKQDDDPEETVEQAEETVDEVIEEAAEDTKDVEEAE